MLIIDLGARDEAVNQKMVVEIPNSGHLTGHQEHDSRDQATPTFTRPPFRKNEQDSRSPLRS
jgi:hypothetical protein